VTLSQEELDEGLKQGDKGNSWASIDLHPIELKACAMEA